MKRNHFTKISLGCLLCLLMFFAGSCISIGGCALPAKYERTVHLLAPLPAGGLFDAETHNGSITISGADVADCNLTARITARATNEQNARELAEETKITLETSGDKLIARIEKPTSMIRKSVSVDLEIRVPNRTNTELNTHNGDIRITNITGEVDGTTHNGKVIAEQVAGDIKLRTHNGSIICEKISGDVKLQTHNGDVRTSYSESAPPVCNVSIVTHNGGVHFNAPPNFSAEADVSTHNGSVHTDLPIAVIGKISKTKLIGKIGTGQGELNLQTHNGSIKIR
jgi:DUF4097 and DUF4098 domain-containing protein YvlB